MNCETIHLGSPLARRLHQWRCPECRAARAADMGLRRGIEHLRAEPAPATGLARTLAAIGAVPVMPVQRSNKRKKAALRRLLMPTGMVTCVAAASIAGWAYYIDRDPGIEAPVPNMPSQNGFIGFRMAYAAETSPKDVDEAVVGKGHKVMRHWTAPLVIPGIGQLGAHAGVATGATPTGMLPTYPSTIEVIEPWTLAKKAELVRKNSEALRLIREGLKMAYWTPPVRSASDRLDYLSEDRGLARLLELEAQVREAQGDVAGAVNSRLDAIELGSKLTCGSTTIGRLVGIACEAIGRKHLWAQVNRLNAQQAREAALRMQHNIRWRVPFASTLEEEEWAGVSMIETIFSDRRWRMNMGDLVGNGNNNPVTKWQSNLWGYFTLLPYSKHRIVQDYMTMMAAEINAARGAYDVRAEEGKKKRLTALQEKQDPITRMMFPLFDQARFMDVAGCQTQDVLLMTTLALRAFWLEHHYYPNDLSMLVPKYLAAVPGDPFAQSKPLKFHTGTVGGTGYSLWGSGDSRWSPGYTGWAVVYSVGPDGMDNGGKPIDNQVQHPKSNAAEEEKQEEMRREIRPDSKGDIIAGLNVSAGARSSEQ